ncbi:MAG: flagellar biosynthesis protein [Bacteroidota bacterium]
MTVQQIAGRVAPPPLPGGGPPAPPTPSGPSFADLLDRATQPPRHTLSAHAAQRVAERGIDLPEAARIEAALDTLTDKGARDAVLVSADAALVVNVPSRTVVTALAPGEMADRVVTQIDSALFL